MIQLTEQLKEHYIDTHTFSFIKMEDNYMLFETSKVTLGGQFNLRIKSL